MTAEATLIPLRRVKRGHIGEGFAVILGLARESRGTKSITLGIYTLTREGASDDDNGLDSRPHPVIPVTPVITAIGCDDWGDGNPEEQSQPPVGQLIKNR